MTKALSPDLLENIFSAIPAYGGAPKDIWGRMDRWSLITVRHGLRELVDAGCVRFEGEDGARVYFRVTAQDGQKKKASPRPV